MRRPPDTRRASTSARRRAKAGRAPPRPPRRAARPSTRAARRCRPPSSAGKKRISRRGKANRRDPVNDVLLAVIAVATLAIAIAQIGVMVVAGRLARRVERLTERLEREVAPLFGHLNAIGRDAARATSLAAVQVERADKVLADIAVRIDAVLTSLQST